VSERHANFIVNDRTATAADVRRLAEMLRDEVNRQTGVRLETEIEFAGDWRGWPWPPDSTASE
jgi:UDP-N-acetylmuramate dehydrogenase